MSLAAAGRAALRSPRQICLAMALVLGACAAQEPSPSLTLVPGQESHAMPVRDAQIGLLEVGYDPGPVDGVMGPRTRGAIRAFQRAQGLALTGRIDPPFADALRREQERALLQPGRVSPPIDTAPDTTVASADASALPPPAPGRAVAGAAVPGDEPALPDADGTDDPAEVAATAGVDADPAAEAQAEAEAQARGEAEAEAAAQAQAAARAEADAAAAAAQPAPAPAPVAVAGTRLTYRAGNHPRALVEATRTPDGAVPDVRYASVDLTGDGVPDAIWNNTGTAYCGTAGCSYEVLFSRSGTWQPVARFLAFDVEAGSGSTGGVRDLVVTGRRGSAVWRWTGSAYAPAG